MSPCSRHSLPMLCRRRDSLPMLCHRSQHFKYREPLIQPWRQYKSSPGLNSSRLHQRQHRYCQAPFFIAGTDNVMADNTSRLQHLTHSPGRLHTNPRSGMARNVGFMTPPVFPYTPSCADLAGVVVALPPGPAVSCCFEGMDQP